MDEVVPDMRIYNSIPLYYRQLFTYKHNPTDEFWFGREQALKKAEKAFRRFMDGYDSTTAIIGKPNSGKSFLSSYIARRYFEQDQIFTINPPDSGSINPKIFGKVMEHATRIAGSPHKILEKLPTKSTLVFNSLELWWQRSPDGFMVLDMIFALIDRYADKHFFIFNLNEYAFQLINSMQNTEHYFLNVIRCEPFNAQELKEIILFRHRSSPLKFRFNGKPEQDIPDYEMAGLFTAHFNYSKGNIGAALHSWLRHIEKANDDTLMIRKPVSPKNATILRSLSSDDCLMIMQLLLHKRLTVKRLNKIFTEPQEIILKRVGMLKRIGIIQNKENGIVILNSYLTPYLIDELVRRHMILG